MESHPLVTIGLGVEVDADGDPRKAAARMYEIMIGVPDRDFNEPEAGSMGRLQDAPHTIRPLPNGKTLHCFHFRVPRLWVEDVNIPETVVAVFVASTRAYKRNRAAINAALDTWAREWVKDEAERQQQTMAFQGYTYSAVVRKWFALSILALSPEGTPREDAITDPLIYYADAASWRMFGEEK